MPDRRYLWIAAPLVEQGRAELKAGQPRRMVGQVAAAVLMLCWGCLQEAPEPCRRPAERCHPSPLPLLMLEVCLQVAACRSEQLQMLEEVAGTEPAACAASGSALVAAAAILPVGWMAGQAQQHPGSLRLAQRLVAAGLAAEV